MRVCLLNHRARESERVFTCNAVCVPGIISVNVCVWRQWTVARPHYCHSPHCLKERRREAERALSVGGRKMETKAPNYTNAGERLGEPAHGHVLWMRENGCRDNPSGSFRGGPHRYTPSQRSAPPPRRTHRGAAPCADPNSSYNPLWWVFRREPCCVHCSGWSSVCPLLHVSVPVRRKRRLSVSGEKHVCHLPLLPDAVCNLRHVHVGGQKLCCRGGQGTHTHTFNDIMYYLASSPNPTPTKP